MMNWLLKQTSRAPSSVTWARLGLSFILLGSMALSGCFPARSRLYEGQRLPAERVAVLTNSYALPSTASPPLVHVELVDGQEIHQNISGLVDVEMLPGRHSLTVKFFHSYTSPGGRSSVVWSSKEQTIAFVAEAGRTYVIVPLMGERGAAIAEMKFASRAWDYETWRPQIFDITTDDWVPVAHRTTAASVEETPSAIDLVEVGVKREVLDLIRTWDPRIRFYTSSTHPITTLKNLQFEDVAFCVEGVDGFVYNGTAFLDQAGIRDKEGKKPRGMQVISVGSRVFTKDFVERFPNKKPPRLFCTWSTFEEAKNDEGKPLLEGAARVVFVQENE